MGRKKLDIKQKKNNFSLSHEAQSVIDGLEKKVKKSRFVSQAIVEKGKQLIEQSKQLISQRNESI